MYLIALPAERNYSPALEQPVARKFARAISQEWMEETAPLERC